MSALSPADVPREAQSLGPQRTQRTQRTAIGQALPKSGCPLRNSPIFAPFTSFAKKKPLSPRPARGFTLLELIVAIAVFAVAATMAYSGLDLLLRSRAGLEQSAERQRELELAVLALERDLRQALGRPARGPYGDELPAFAGSGVAAEWSVLDLTGGPDGVHAQLVRVRWGLVDGALWRGREPVLDRSPRETARNRKLLDGVQRLAFHYLAGANQRLDQWPPRTGITAPERLPRAVEVSLQLADVGEIVRLVELPETPR